MTKHALLSLAALGLAACASAPPAPESAPSPAPAPAPVAWALEPAPEPAPPPKADGPWRVSLISVKTEPKAERLTRRFADKGYRVEIETVELEGTTWHRVVFPGQASMAESKELLAKLEQESGVKGGWIPMPRRAEP